MVVPPMPPAARPQPVNVTVVMPEERSTDVQLPAADHSRDQKERGGVDRSDEPNKISSPAEQKTVLGPNKTDAPNNSEVEQKTIPEQLGNNSPPELIVPDATPSQAALPTFKKVGKVGRQRRYDELGIEEIEPIREVFLLRHLTGKSWPGLSNDMETYYEKFYFTKPKRGSKEYARHVKCWERRTRWIAGHTSP